jgi:hypothetical protein
MRRAAIAAQLTCFFREYYRPNMTPDSQSDYVALKSHERRLTQRLLHGPTTILRIRRRTLCMYQATIPIPIAPCIHLKLRSHFQNPSLMHVRTRITDITEVTTSFYVIFPSDLHTAKFYQPYKASIPSRASIAHTPHLCASKLRRSQIPTRSQSQFA